MNQSTSTENEWVTAKAVASRLGVAKSTVYQWADDCLLPKTAVMRIGRTVRFDLAQIVKYGVKQYQQEAAIK